MPKLPSGRSDPLVLRLIRNVENARRVRRALKSDGQSYAEFENIRKYSNRPPRNAIPILYAAVALITFGFAANERAASCHVAYEAYACIPGAPVMIGSMAAAFWPLYWSWEVADAVRS